MLKKISVVIPVYNIQSFIGDCLQSVIDQDYSNLEIIVINDGSKDSSLQICQQYADKDSRIVLINKQNEGQGSARNTGLECATGDYLTFIDGDDFVDPNYVSSLTRQQEKYKSDIAITFNKEFSQKTKQFYVMMDPAPGNEQYNRSYTPQEWIREFSEKSSPVFNSGCMKLYNMNVIKKFRFINGHVAMEDAMLSWKIALMANTISFENIPSYIYRVDRDGSTTLKNQDNEYAYCEDKILNERISLMKASNLETSYLHSKYKESLMDLRETALNVGDDDTNNLMQYKLDIINNHKGNIN